MYEVTFPALDSAAQVAPSPGGAALWTSAAIGGLSVGALIEQLAAAPAVGQDYRPYALSPGGGALAFEWYRDGDWQIFLKSLPDGEPVRVGDLADRCGCPQFSPGGRHLYFTCDDRGSECYDIYRYDIDAGVAVNLLPETPDLAPLPDPDLSPDGTRLAMTVSHGAGYAVAVMPAEPSPGGGALRYLTEHPYTECSPRWSRDGAFLAVTTGTRGQDTAIIVIDVESGETRHVGGSDEFFAGQLAWSPDGRRLAFAGGPGPPAIGVYELATGSITWAWEDHHIDAHHPVWAPDGAALAFLVDAEGETGLCHIDLSDGAVTEYSIGPGNHYAPSFTPDGASLMCVLSRPDSPADLYRVELADGDVTALTDSLPGELRDTPFAAGDPVWFTSWDHLAEVPGILVEPDEPNGAAVVIVHGGPTWHHSNEWDPLRRGVPWLRGSQCCTRTIAEATATAAAGSSPTAGSWARARSSTWRRRTSSSCGTAATRRGSRSRVAAGRLPHHGRRHPVPGPVGGRRGRRPVLRLHRQPARPGRPGGPALVGPAEHRGCRARPGPARVLLADQPPRRASRRRSCSSAAPSTPAARRGRSRGRGGAARARRECDYVVYPDEGHEISGLEHRVDYERRTVDFILEHTGSA